MYNGIGLQSARGSGTSGYVQKNLSVGVKKLHTKEQFLRELDQKRKTNMAPPKKANQQIVDHQRRREILIQSMKLRQKLQSQGLSSSQVQQKVKRAQQILKQRLQSGKLNSKAKDSHVLTQAKQKQYMKLSKAFGVVQKRSVGSAFDFEAQRQDKLKRQYEKSLKERYQCTFEGCDKVYREKELLDRHLKYKHPSIGAQTIKQTIKKAEE